MFRDAVKLKVGILLFNPDVYRCIYAVYTKKSGLHMSSEWSSSFLFLAERNVTFHLLHCVLLFVLPCCMSLLYRVQYLHTCYLHSCYSDFSYQRAVFNHTTCQTCLRASLKTYLYPTHCLEERGQVYCMYSSILWFNLPGWWAVPGFQPPPWGPPVGKTHPPAPGASVSSGSPSLSPAGPAQLALMPTLKLGTVPLTSALGHCSRLADAAGPAGDQNWHR